MKNLFRKILASQSDLILATIVATEGSSPRGTGAQILLSDSGRLAGTIGGGAVEFRTEQEARRLLKEKHSKICRFPLHATSDGGIDMVCGGAVTVLLQYIAATDIHWHDAAEAVLQHLASRQRGWLVLRESGAPSVIGADSRSLAGPEVPKSNLGSAFVAAEDAFYIPLPLEERAVLFGAGHCSMALTPLLRSVGFHVTVFDDRPAMANRERFPGADQIIVGDFRRISRFLTLTPEDYIVIMTSGHGHDFEVEEQVLRSPAAYVGVMGSKKKTAFVNERLRQAGVEEAAIASVHTPIGTAIKAVTPEEIAVSIAGEMIYVRACRRENPQ